MRDDSDAGEIGRSWAGCCSFPTSAMRSVWAAVSTAVTAVSMGPGAAAAGSTTASVTALVAAAGSKMVSATALAPAGPAAGLALGVGVVGVAGRLGGGLSLVVGMTAHAGRRAGGLAGGSTGKGGV